MGKLKLKKLAKNKTLLIGVALVVLIVLFIALRPSDKADAPAATREFNLQIVGGELTPRLEKLTAYEGQNLVFKVTSDTADELHIHGYDQSLELQPNEAAELEFKADKTGRFEVELHKADLQLTALEVQPEP